MIAYISGHLDLTSEEWNEHYHQWILRAIAMGDSFVVGDARGADWIAQCTLQILMYDKVTVYHMFESPRNCTSTKFRTIGGFKSDKERDEAMTAASDYDIAWVRKGREKSGTAKNIKRRQN